MLYSVEPRSSQCPSMVTRTCGYDRRNSAVLVNASRASVRRSDLLKSKNASFTFCSNNSLMLWLFEVGFKAGAAAPSVTRAVAVALPPGPVAVIVYVVESVGFTGVDPCSATLPTPGSMSASVASVEVQLSVTVSPLFTVVGVAFSVTVGCAEVGAGAGAGCDVATCFLQPPKNPSTAMKPNANVSCRELRTCMNCLLQIFFHSKKQPIRQSGWETISTTSSATRSALHRSV